MSGIVGIYDLGGQPIAEDTLERMLSMIAHRGPDGAASWRAGEIGLGQSSPHLS